MNITICSPSYIAYHASKHTRAILSQSNSHDAVAMSIETLATTSVAQVDYTRSVAVVARQIANRLKCEDAPLAHQFTECLADAVVVAFFAYWRVWLRFILEDIPLTLIDCVATY